MPSLSAIPSLYTYFMLEICPIKIPILTLSDSLLCPLHKYNVCSRRGCRNSIYSINEGSRSSVSAMKVCFVICKSSALYNFVHWDQPKPPTSQNIMLSIGDGLIVHPEAEILDLNSSRSSLSPSTGCVSSKPKIASSTKPLRILGKTRGLNGNFPLCLKLGSLARDLDHRIGYKTRVVLMDSGTARVGIFSFQTCPIQENQLAGGLPVAEKEGWAETRAIVTMKDYIPA